MEVFMWIIVMVAMFGVGYLIGGAHEMARSNAIVESQQRIINQLCASQDELFEKAYANLWCGDDPPLSPGSTPRC